MNDSRQGCSAASIVFLVIAVIAFVVFRRLFWWVLGFVVLTAILLGVALIIYNARQKKKRMEMVADGITAGEVEDYFKEASQRIQAVRRNYFKLKDDNMRVELDSITDRFKKISEIVKGDLSDFKQARRYLNTMLSSLETIVDQSVRLFNVPEKSDEINNSLGKALEGMVLLRQSADKQIGKLHENNLLELDVEIEVLKKTLSSRGLTNPEDGNNEL
ncbi:MAG TPA: 5-bromo-4-chloroindolyl phosphate hydrolysis family protein [Clostridia bacterium]|nr:5-bromo-4-chloroindolyl phosphate hydrolysis family protein [Clostridia bacterium]HPQ47286.1 5-bromo-4-chloroindolyl phosphate hydrolysis family protein [Clostridia bacterium]HRX41441.1 5-bromo-4-chloroindolyl phosphate hydrolysis family protein [Clostridia bacterium]